MEKNHSTHVFYIIIIVLLVMIIGFLWYQLGETKSSNEKIMNQLQNNLSNKETTINTLENTLDSISNQLDNTNTSTSQNSTTSNSNSSQITQELNGIDVLYVTNATQNKDNTYTLQGVIYTQYTLSHDEVMQIQNSGSIRLNGESYTVKSNGNEWEIYDSSNYALYKIKSKNANEYFLECQAQLENVWKRTNETKEITLPGNTICTGLWHNPDTTVAENFKNYTPTTASETTHPDASKTYSFHFENGKCTKVINELTSIE